MQRIMVIALSVVAGFAFAVLLLVGSPRAGAGGATPLSVANGDTNGDGQIDISDAVYLLIYMFRGGDPPVALADSPEVLERLRVLEERMNRIEPVGSLLDSTRDELAELAARVDASSDLTVLLANAKGRYSASEDPANPTLFPMHFVSDNNGGDGPIALSGASIDNETIRFHTDRPGHLLLRVRGGHYSGAPATDLRVYLDDGQLRPTFTQGPVFGSTPPTLMECVARDVPAGDHALALKGWVSPGNLDSDSKVAAFLAQQSFQKCTLTVQFAPSAGE